MDEQHRASEAGFLSNLGVRVTGFTERWVPDAWVIVWSLTAVAFVMALIWGNTTVKGCFQAWGNGIWLLLDFGMDICLLLVSGYVLASAPPVKRLLEKLASLPNPERPGGAIAAMCLFSMITAWINWSFSLIGSSILALFLIRANPRTDYRLLVAAAYLGLGCTWHAGISGSAPLEMSFSQNPFVASGLIETAIPLTSTVFTLLNIFLTIIVVAAVTTLMVRMHPPKENTYRIKPDATAKLRAVEPSDISGGAMTFSQRLNQWPGLNIFAACIGLTWLGIQAASDGFFNSIVLPNTNLLLLIAGMLLHWRPWSFLQAAKEAGSIVWGVIVQFPFYAGIFGLIQLTGLGAAMTKVLTGITTPGTFLLLTYWYTGMLNYLVPLGSWEWVMTGANLIAAAQQLDVSIPKLVITFAWGNMLTDMIHPFWAVAMLAVTKLEFREIVGWLLIVFVAYFVITSAAFLMLSFI